MGGRDLANERQSDAVALPLGRKEGHEYLLALIRRDPWAVVSYHNGHSEHTNRFRTNTTAAPGICQLLSEQRARHASTLAARLHPMRAARVGKQNTLVPPP
jgi:hypothetical protein